MLPYTTEVLFSLFDQYNRQIWPLHIVFYGLAIVSIALMLWPNRHGARIISLMLAAAWAWTAMAFHYLQFATINFAAPFYALLFLVQALLLVWSGVFGNRIDYRLRVDLFGGIGLALMLYALAGCPLLDWLAGNDWHSVRLFGVAPQPTMVFSAGVLLLARPRTPLYLLAIPVLWALIAGATAWVLQLTQDYVACGAVIVTSFLAIWKNRRSPD